MNFAEEATGEACFHQRNLTVISWRVGRSERGRRMPLPMSDCGSAEGGQLLGCSTDRRSATSMPRASEIGSSMELRADYQRSTISISSSP